MFFYRTFVNENDYIKYSCNKHGISSINKSLGQDLPQTHNNISDKNLWEFKAKRPA